MLITAINIAGFSALMKLSIASTGKNWLSWALPNSVQTSFLFVFSANSCAPLRLFYFSSKILIASTDSPNFL
jgi:hypothetical protein